MRRFRDKWDSRWDEDKRVLAICMPVLEQQQAEQREAELAAVQHRLDKTPPIHFCDKCGMEPGGYRWGGAVQEA